MFNRYFWYELSLRPDISNSGQWDMVQLQHFPARTEISWNDLGVWIYTWTQQDLKTFGFFNLSLWIQTLKMALTPLDSSVSNPVDLAGKNWSKNRLGVLCHWRGRKTGKEDTKCFCLITELLFLCQFSLPGGLVLGCPNGKHFQALITLTKSKSMNRVNCSQEC